MADKIRAKDTKMFYKLKIREIFNLYLVKMYWGILQVVVEKFYNLTVVIALSTNV